MKSFSFGRKRFDDNDLLDFSRTEEGTLWLMLRSIDRKDLLAEFSESINSAHPQRISAESIWRDFATDATFGKSLRKFMLQCQLHENEKIDASLESIRSNLYSMTHFHWGGGFRNSLDKAIVSRYVKTEDIIPFDRLEKICDGELREMSRGYLMNSWYNYWSSVLIENLFRRNPGVLPACGKIKNVDFFVDGFPFDLKVTYIPNEYAALIRKRIGVDDPMKLLKAYAKQHEIAIQENSAPEQIRYEIVERMRDSNDPAARKTLAAIRTGWKRTVASIKDNKRALVQWLYENQGDMRFGSENRIFLVLVDMSNPDDSWKLKRNVELVSPLVKKWVRRFKRDTSETMLTEFVFKSRKYKTYADVIFAVKK